MSVRELIMSLKGDSWLASSHLEIFVSLFQPATVVSKKFHQTAACSLMTFQRNFIKLPQFDDISKAV